MPMPSPSNYLRRTGAIADSLATNERLLEIIVQMFQRGEFNRIRLANKAIAEFEAARISLTCITDHATGESHGSRHRPHHA